MITGKIPPQAVEIEQAVLGAMILENESISLVLSEIGPEYFYREEHQMIFNAIANINDRGVSVDFMVIAEELKKSNQLDESGGVYYLTELTNHVASSAHIEHHVQVIKEKYIRRKAIESAMMLESKAYDETYDVADLISDAGSIETELADSIIKAEMASIEDVMNEVVRQAEYRKHRAENKLPIGIPTPIHSLNRLLLGFEPGQFIIIGGRPGHGKTAFALFLAKHQSAQGFKPAFFTLEMTNIGLANRLILGSLDIDPYDFRKGNISDEQLQQVREAATDLGKYNIHISDKASTNVSQIKAEVKKLILKDKCDIVYVDYLQLIKPGHERTREQQISHISRSLKIMAKELSIPVIAMSQLSRAMEQGDKRPKLSALRESGSLEQDTDVVMFIFKPAEYHLFDDNNEEYSDLDVELIVAKQREGALGTVRLQTNISRTMYYENTHVPTVSLDGKAKAANDFVFPQETKTGIVDFSTDVDEVPF